MTIILWACDVVLGLVLAVTGVGLVVMLGRLLLLGLTGCDWDLSDYREDQGGRDAQDGDDNLAVRP